MQRKQINIEAKRRELLVVSNSSVIIALARIGHLDLLQKLFRKVFVPKTVWKEITVESKPGSEEIARADFIRVDEAGDKRLVTLLEEFVDTGEAEAIVLSLERSADLLLVDDRDARNLAKKLGLQVMGTLGVVALAKYKGLIPEVRPIVYKLVKRGCWISSSILERFLRELGEN